MTLSVFATFSLCVYVRFCVRMNASYVMVGVGVVVYVPGMIYIRNIYMYNKGGDTAQRAVEGLDCIIVALNQELAATIAPICNIMYCS